MDKVHENGYPTLPQSERKEQRGLRISQVTKQTGISLVEILVAGLVIGAAIVGVSLMYGTGSSWVAAMGDDRVATGLAQQMIEQLRTQGWPCVTATPPSPPPCEIGVPMTEAAVYPAGVVDAGVRAFTRSTCIQYVSDSDWNDPAYAYTPECPAGDPPTKNTVRVTVTVTATRALGQANPVTLQAWLIKEGP